MERPIRRFLHFFVLLCWLEFCYQALGERSDRMSARTFGFTITAAVTGALLFYVAVIMSAALLVARDELLAMELAAAFERHSSRCSCVMLFS